MIKNYCANPDNIVKQMLEEINMSSTDELFDMIPQNVRIDGLDLPEPKSEMEVQALVKSIAKQNKTDYACFTGGGAYKRFIPACISQIAGRFEFNTAYTPYQPEISQGTLQVIYEFQSMICDLTGMDVSNASVYDAGNACAEAILMAARISGRNKILVSDCINPEYIEVVKTYANAADKDVKFAKSTNYATDIKFVQEKISTGEYAGVLLQIPFHTVGFFHDPLSDARRYHHVFSGNRRFHSDCSFM